MTIKPPLTYWGSKITLAPKIVENFPKHKHYLEPFFGTGAVFLAKPLAQSNILVDTNHHLVTFFKVLRTRPDELLTQCQLSPCAREEYERAQVLLEQRGWADELEHARMVYVLLNQSIIPTLQADKPWKTGHRPFSLPSQRQSIFSLMESEFLAVAQKLRRTQIDNRDALAVIENLGADPDLLIYADPPYIQSTRSHGARYLRDADDAWHGSLLELLRGVDAKVCVSGYSNPLYEDLLSDWAKVTFESRVGVSVKKGGEATVKMECLWMNYDPPGQPGML